MSGAEFVGTLVTVFLGAFLAFFLENFRERRRLRGWIARYLEQSTVLLSRTEAAFPEVLAMLEDMQGQLDRWVSDPPMTPDWAALDGVPVSRAPDLLGPLQGEPMSVVRPEILGSLVAVETSARTLELVSTRLESMHDRFVLPLVLRREAELTDSDRSGLVLFRVRLGEFRAVVSQCGADVAEALGLLRNA